MAMEHFFGLSDNSPRLSVAQIVAHLNSVGLLAHESPDDYGHWVIFDGHESTLNFPADILLPEFVTLDYVSSDPVDFFEALNRALENIGWEVAPIDWE